EVVQCFVDASAKGWYKYLYGDNKAANELIKKDNPDITDEQISFTVEQLKKYGIVDSGDAEQLGIGATSDARMQDFYDKMVKAKVEPEGIDLSKAYTLQPVNKRVGLALTKQDPPPAWRRRMRQPAADSSGALLVLRGVGKAFSNGVTALDNVDLAIREGDFLSLLGPSGCGKSTALRLIAGLSTPTAGAIEWLGSRGVDRSDIGFVFQEPTLLPWATVFDNVWLPLRLRGVSRAKAEPAVTDMLTRVHLQNFATAVPRELSGGMKMRVSIARAMVTKPRVL